MKYIVFINHSSELEKKRIDYYLKKLGNEVKVEEPKKAFFIEVDEEKAEEFFKGLLSKISHSYAEARLKSKIFKVDEEIIYDSDTESTGLYEFQKTKDEAKRAVNLIMARLKGVLYYADDDILRYKLNTKKGFALVEAYIRESAGKCKIWFRVVGFGEVVKFVREKIDKEVESIGGVYG